MKNIGKIIQFEYLNCVRNKAFIIITAAILLLIIASSFLPGVIMSLASPETEKTDNQEIAVICSDSLYGGELVSREFCRCFPETAVVLSKEDIETVKSKVNDSKYRFAAEITGALEYTYITKNNSIYDTNMQNCAQAIKAMYVSTFLEPYGIKADQADALVYADVQNRVLTTGTDQTVNYLPTYILMCMLFVSITSYGQIVAQSVVSEKNTRAMELLITCARPTELMFGKVIGSGLAGFTQLALILTVSVGSLKLVSSSAIPTEIYKLISIEPGSAILAVLFFILGYFMYAFLIGALASCASKSEDLSNLISPVMMLMVIVYMVLIFMCVSENYDNPVIVIMSYLPLSSPMAMFIRATLTDIEPWKIILSAAVQIISTIIIGIAAAGIYRAGVLMYGTAPKPSEIFRIILRDLKEKSKRKAKP